MGGGDRGKGKHGCELIEMVVDCMDPQQCTFH